MSINHKLSIADIITLFRIVGTVLLVVLHPFSTSFFCVYALAGLTDVLDGWIARKTKTTSDFGARLDSVADLLFYAVMLFRVLPFLWKVLSNDIWCAVIAIIIVRISAYLVAAVKYHQFVFLHTYLNKLTGVMVFFIPFLLVTAYTSAYCIVTCVIAIVAALEELAIHFQRQTYQPNIKSIFQKER